MKKRHLLCLLFLAPSVAMASGKGSGTPLSTTSTVSSGDTPKSFAQLKAQSDAQKEKAKEARRQAALSTIEGELLSIQAFLSGAIHTINLLNSIKTGPDLKKNAKDPFYLQIQSFEKMRDAMEKAERTIKLRLGVLTSEAAKGGNPEAYDGVVKEAQKFSSSGIQGSLALSGCGITNEQLKILCETVATLPFIKTLTLSGNEGINNEGLAHIIKLVADEKSGCEVLDLSNCSFDYNAVLSEGLVQALSERKSQITITLSNKDAEKGLDAIGIETLKLALKSNISITIK